MKGKRKSRIFIIPNYYLEEDIGDCIDPISALFLYDCYLGMKASVEFVPEEETCEIRVLVDGETVVSAIKPADTTYQYLVVNYYLMKFK